METNGLLQALYDQPGQSALRSPLVQIFQRRSRVLRIALFGCTGSIGQNTIDVVRANADRLRIVALAAGRSEERLVTMGRELGVDRLALGEPGRAVPGGSEALRALAASEDIDVVVNAVVGAAGLAVTLGALDGHHDLALANKESLVMAGDLVMRRAKELGVAVRPIDSEHSSLTSCLRGRSLAHIRRVYLTASGGPFRGRTAGSFDDVTVEEALNHPTWSMGPKITIDSATLMNKGLEVIEAHHLFGLPADRIAVIVHPQSIIHAMVENADGSVVADLAPPDMRIPIQRALLPEGRFAAPLDLLALSGLTFAPPDLEAFPCLDLAFRALAAGGTAPCVLNAANEVAVHAFLQKRIRFGSISAIIRTTLDAHQAVPVTAEGDVLDADRWARTRALEAVAAAA